MIYEICGGGCPTENANGGGRAAAGGAGNTDCLNTSGTGKNAELVIYRLAVEWQAERVVETVVSDLARLEMLYFSQCHSILWTNWQLKAKRP